MASIQSMLIRFLLRRADMWNKPLEKIRNDMEKLKAQVIPEGLEIKSEDLNGVPIERMIPLGDIQRKVILYFHGGGFCLGIYFSNREFVAQIAKESGFTVIMPNYRLAPESPFPGALEDAVSVYRGLLNEGNSGKDIVVMGDSSGCALALSALLVLKKSGMEMPSALAFITPVIDFAGKGESLITRAVKDPFRLKDPLGIAKIYIGTNNPSSPMISPVYGELEGMPPMLIHAADYDVFLSDSVSIKEKADKIDVNVELKIWSKMWHIFHMQYGIVPEAKVVLSELCSYVKEKLGEK
jgi:epsilon-lactone hydrolase